ncbi:MAG: chromosome segregation protein SMC [Chitinophagaceae bacterium]|nr:chromosome segregation protein SMC [Chitinophagaceae bacterium]
MRLKSLEIKGFKSFADKTTINFDQGITGIIGPNGCGKSNIIDSIRWVIGEHKISNLRSENLESLVFNGSRTRSASGLAEVSLTFENTRNLLPTEFGTVTVTRKFFKSGESEYRLNDVNCRLKDIHNLFLDTGISNDSYAIIELGMVDDIIKDKDNSRRRMVEQAAGITIYKTRKREAKLKLDATEQDLARIEDLLFEINNQLKSLESQAKKAEKYYEIRKEYKELSIELAKAVLEGFNLTYKDLNEQQQTEIDKRFELEADIAKDEAAIEQDKLNFIAQEKSLQEMQHNFNALIETVRGKENEKSLGEQRMQYLKERELGLRDFLGKSEGQLSGLEESIAFTTAQITDEESRLGEFTEKMESLKESVEEKRQIFDEKRVAIDTVRRDNQALQRKQFDAEKEVAVADASIQNIQRSIMQGEEEQDQRKQQRMRLELEKEEKEAELEQKRTDLTQAQEQHEYAKEQIFKTQEKAESLRNQLAEESRKLDARKNEHALLKSLIDSMEGYPESVKFLHNNPDWNQSAPILSDIIYVKEAYRAAVENVLEPYLNYYIVEDLEEGLKAVHLLHANQKGKANFFLLDKINAFSTANQHAKPEGTIPALDVIEVDARYRKLAEYLLSNVYIAENDEVLLHSNGAIVLEKNGRYVKGRYYLTGGSVGLFEGKKIGRAKNLEKLQEEILAQEEVVSELKAAIQTKHSEVADFSRQLKEDAIRKMQEEINALTNQTFSLQNKLENLQQMEENGSRRIEELRTQLEDKHHAISDVREELEQLNVQLQDLQNRTREAEAEYSVAEQEYNFSNAAFNDGNLQFTRFQSKVNSLKQEHQFKSGQLNDLKTRVEQSGVQLKEVGEQIADTMATLENTAALLVDLLRRKEEEEKKLNEADQAYYNSRNALAEKESALRLKQKSKEQLDHLVTEIKDKLGDLKLKLAGMKERMSVEFKVDLDAILEEARNSDATAEDLQASCDRMKKRLENMGEVNPTAIEAFQEMSKRYEFILEQKNDLVNAKDSLLQTIQEVEATANQKFLETFNMVRENFQKVFKALFTEEDTADILLENPENLAETSIDIIAKPKGKRPSSITQLSGGEKTLTATALLFAIYLIKPAPFCILDEVDAPLDDANVNKFTNMIRQFSENSQFIIITHNKMTMSTVDVIYGVTMQEPGVSKLVPVDFRGLSN